MTTIIAIGGGVAATLLFVAFCIHHHRINQLNLLLGRHNEKIRELIAAVAQLPSIGEHQKTLTLKVDSHDRGTFDLDAKVQASQDEILLLRDRVAQVEAAARQLNDVVYRISARAEVAYSEAFKNLAQNMTDDMTSREVSAVRVHSAETEDIQDPLCPFPIPGNPPAIPPPASSSTPMIAPMPAPQMSMSDLLWEPPPIIAPSSKISTRPDRIREEDPT